MAHKISTDRAYEIDNDWGNAGMPGDGLRIASYRTAGNGSRSVLCIPGNDNAPRYQDRSHDPEFGEYAPGYYHDSGPTLDEWMLQAEYADAAETTAGLLQF